MRRGVRRWRLALPKARWKGDAEDQAHLASIRSLGRTAFQVAGVSADRPAAGADRHRPRQHRGRARRGHAPATTANFLRYVLEGFYSDGEFFRTVTEDNQPDDAVKIAVVQAGAEYRENDETYDPIALERTRDTGLRHLDGTISMARSGPDTATHSFFICVGDQPELDFGGKRNPDGQGFAAFGRVVEGMELVREIHAMPADGQSLDPPLSIQRAVRVH